jgi:hypothetical protein
MKIQTFIFNWRNQYKKTKEKLYQLKQIGIDPIVINSDDLYKEHGWHNIGEDSYFTAQYLKAIELFDGDVLFHIQADASYYDWKSIYQAAEQYFEKYKCGIYAPNVDYTFYDSSRADLSMFKFGENKNLKMVSNPDCTCWFVHKDIINEAKEREINFAPFKMGWSFDIVYTALSFMKKRPVIRDYQFTIQHPQGTNYNKEIAEKEMHEFYTTLPKDIQEAFSYIKGDRFKLAKYYKNAS